MTSTTTSKEQSPALVDTNVLVYALHPQAKHHLAARQLLDSSSTSLCVTSQVLAEFYAVVTDPRRVETPRQPSVALGAVDCFISMPNMSLLPSPVDVVGRWTTLLQQQPATGQAVFDVQLVATMLGNDVHQIYTFNRKDFDRFDEVTVLTP